ncbi:MAG: isoprenylcysteine carboxylmethyltransferase family protein [Candidatus Bathyarchaeota archaeon]|nr:MAG: isoprenylcysteine carboxylmethyltransferase family protein [Candidatus Bathyarchaeota archaeon]
MSTLICKRARQLIAYTFPTWDNPVVSLLGIFVLSIGGIVTVSGRAQLAKYGSGILRIKNDHKLITTGVFRYIRHPIYAGGFLGVIGLYLSFRSILILTSISLIHFFVIRYRLLFEEQLLLQEFGDHYKNYMKRTKRLIPFIY